MTTPAITQHITLSLPKDFRYRREKIPIKHSDTTIYNDGSACGTISFTHDWLYPEEPIKQILTLLDQQQKQFGTEFSFTLDSELSLSIINGVLQVDLSPFNVQKFPREERHTDAFAKHREERNNRRYSLMHLLKQISQHPTVHTLQIDYHQSSIYHIFCYRDLLEESSNIIKLNLINTGGDDEVTLNKKNSLILVLLFQTRIHLEEVHQIGDNFAPFRFKRFNERVLLFGYIEMRNSKLRFFEPRILPVDLEDWKTCFPNVTCFLSV